MTGNTDSGSGKTTLLDLVGGLDTPDGGRITVGGTGLSGLGEHGLPELRRDRIGFIFQSFGLLPVLTAAQNGGVPCACAGPTLTSVRSEWRGCSRRWVSATTPSSAPQSFPTAGSSASPSPVPSPTGPPS